MFRWPFGRVIPAWAGNGSPVAALQASSAGDPRVGGERPLGRYLFNNVTG
ncbi:hypothetical protein RBY4I_3771 [Rhodobacterales bacterium Y4I]|nr:hypothetical protein RBY4I_3771 [Rhodobacterales bacterium Y4I]